MEGLDVEEMANSMRNLGAGTTHSPIEEGDREVGLDLNDEQVLRRETEDPKLMEHMDEARRVLRSTEGAGAGAPELGKLERSDVATRKSLSTLSMALKDMRMSLQCALEEHALTVANVGKISVGVSPHGYPRLAAPPDEPLKGCLATLGEKLAAASTSFGGVQTALAEIEKELTRARRGYETTVEGLKAHAPKAAGTA